MVPLSSNKSVESWVPLTWLRFPKATFKQSYDKNCWSSKSKRIADDFRHFICVAYSKFYPDLVTTCPRWVLFLLPFSILLWIQNRTGTWKKEILLKYFRKGVDWYFLGPCTCQIPSQNVHWLWQASSAIVAPVCSNSMMTFIPIRSSFSCFSTFS